MGFRQWRAAAASRREAVHFVGRLEAAQFRPPRRIYDPDRESDRPRPGPRPGARRKRSEDHSSELQSLMRISYAAFRLKNKSIQNRHQLIIVNMPTPINDY